MQKNYGLMKLNRFFFFLLLAGIAVACQSKGGDAASSTNEEQAKPAPPENSVTGVISYREDKTIPPDAEITISLVDLNKPDEDRVVAEITFNPEGKQIPLDFIVPYDKEKLDENGNFALEGLVTFAGYRIFEDIDPVQVITNGKRRDVVLMMRSARGKVEE